MIYVEYVGYPGTSSRTIVGKETNESVGTTDQINIKDYETPMRHNIEMSRVRTKGVTWSDNVKGNDVLHHVNSNVSSIFSDGIAMNDPERMVNVIENTSPGPRESGGQDGGFQHIYQDDKGGIATYGATDTNTPHNKYGNKTIAAEEEEIFEAVYPPSNYVE